MAAQVKITTVNWYFVICLTLLYVYFFKNRVVFSILEEPDELKWIYVFTCGSFITF